MTQRGKLTPELERVWRERTGRELTTEELRLTPYIQHVMLNDRKLDPAKISPGERAILQEWREAGFIGGGMTGLGMTREFWESICEILWIGYATYDCREIEAEEAA